MPWIKKKTERILWFLCLHAHNQITNWYYRVGLAKLKDIYDYYTSGQLCCPFPPLPLCSNALGWSLNNASEKKNQLLQFGTGVHCTQCDNLGLWLFILHKTKPMHITNKLSWEEYIIVWGGTTIWRCTCLSRRELCELTAHSQRWDMWISPYIESALPSVPCTVIYMVEVNKARFSILWNWEQIILFWWRRRRNNECS